MKFLVIFIITLVIAIILLLVNPKTNIKSIFHSFINAFKGKTLKDKVLNFFSFFLLPTAVGVFFYLSFNSYLNNVDHSLLLTFDATFLALLTIFFGIDGLTADSEDPNYKRFSTSIDETMGTIFISIILILIKMILLFFYPSEICKDIRVIPLIYYGISGFVIALFLFIIHSFFNHKHRQNSPKEEQGE